MRKNRPRVVVLLAAYNGERWLPEQLDSILNQEKVDLDIFISIDLSTDRTLEICQVYQRDYPQIKLLSYGQTFGGAAKNFYRLIREVDFSPYEYVALADQDDIWLPNKLHRAIRTIQEKQVEAYSSNVTAFWKNGRKKIVHKSYSQKQYDYLFEAAGPGCTYVFTVCSFSNFKEKIIQYDVENIVFHDWFIYAYYRHMGYQWYIDHYAKNLLYRQHEKNQVGINRGVKAYLKRLRMINDQWYCSQVKAIIKILDTIYPLGIKVKKGSLVRHFWKLRRRPRDAWLLLLVISFGGCK